MAPSQKRKGKAEKEQAKEVQQLEKEIEQAKEVQQLEKEIEQAQEVQQLDDWLSQSPEAPQTLVDPKAVVSPVVDIVTIDPAVVTQQEVGIAGTGVKAFAGQYVNWTVVQVKDSYIYAKGTIGDVIISIRSKLAPLAETSVATTLIPYVVKIQGVTAHVIGRVGDAILAVVAQGHQALQKATTAYSTVCNTIMQNTTYLVSKVTQLYEASMERAHPYIARIVEPPVAYVKDGWTYAVGRLGDMAISIRGKGENIMNRILQTYARTRLLIVDATRAVYTRVGDITSPVISSICSGLHRCQVTIKDGFLTIKGRVGDVVVFITLRVSNAVAAIKNGSKLVITTVGDKTTYLVVKATDALAGAYSIAADASKTVKDKVVETIADERFRVSSGSAVAGAVACGSTGGATGFVTGGAVGAALGLVPAVFTFGLSIPIGAAIGSGTGLCVGALTGGTVGFVGGGAAGYGAQKHKAEIGTKLSQCKDYMKSKKSAIYMGATGGTA